MKIYERPVVVIDDAFEGVFLASGGNDSADNTEEKVRCRYGRTEANPGSDVCQGCSASNGASSDGAGLFRNDFKGCVDNLPIKEAKAFNYIDEA